MALLTGLHPSLGLAASVLLFALHLAVLARAITRAQRTPASRVAWVAVIGFLPVLGMLAYGLFGETSIGRGRLRRLDDTQRRLACPDAVCVPATVPARDAALFALGASINGFAPVGGNRIVLLGDPDAPATEPARDSDAAIAALVADIAQAQAHVHLGFYIWLDDHNGGKVVDALCAAARRGVHCRAMVDALGSRAFVHSPRWQQLREAGVRTLATLDDIPRLGHLAIGRLDLRNHRKLAVIDNRIAYVGSQNCADPAFLIERAYAPWIDLLLRCEGPIARQAQAIFLSAWIAETGEALEALPAALPAPPAFDDGVVAQMFATGPAGAPNAMSDMFVAAMAGAQRELLITTPYFVPDEAMLRALCATARRGVATTLVLPARNNSRLVANASRSTYAELLRCGVQLLEYPLGLLHSKSLTVDGALALVGSANMDRRSLQLNFENNLLIADAEVVACVRRRQLGYLSVSRPVDAAWVAGWSFPRRLLQDGLGMLAPLL